MRFRSALLAIAVVVLLPRGSEASPIIFTDRALFESYTATLPGLPPLSLETFDNPVWSLDFVSDTCLMFVPGLTIHHDCHDGGVDPTGTWGAASFPANFFSVGGGFDLPQSALGFDYFASGPSPFQFMGLEFVLSGSGFLGVVDTAQPSMFMGYIQPIGGGLRMDNLLLRVPEPATWLLFGSAFALLQVVRYRRRSSR